MKIRYGAWVELPGISTKEVAQIREVKYDSYSLYLFTVNYNNDKRALEDAMIEVFISAPKKDVIRVTARHFSGGRKKMPEFELNLDKIPLDVSENGDKLTVTNGEGSGTYPPGKTVTIKAGNAPKGSTFAYWSCSNEDVIFEDSTDWITTLTMVSADVTVIANYTGQYTLEVEYGSGSGSYPAGAKVAISAVEAPQGRAFASWVTKTSGLIGPDGSETSITNILKFSPTCGAAKPTPLA